jgi:pimeloyl-ACP methyl ester carboxylesterase
MKPVYAFKTAHGRDAVHEAYDAFLRNMRIPHEQLHVGTRFGQAFAIAAGRQDAPNLILLHGSGMNAAMWLEDMEIYAGHFRVYAVDLQGEPGKSDGRQLPFRGPDFEQWLHDVFAGLSIERAGIVGISLGAWLALKFAIAHPHMVEKLALLCPAGIGPQRASFAFRALPHMLMGERGLERLYRLLNGGKPLPREMLDYQKLIGKHFNFRREQIPLFTDEELSRLSMPSRLYVGRKDVMFHSLKTAERFGRRMPHADIVVLPDAGHTLVGLADDILAFLQGT